MALSGLTNFTISRDDLILSSLEKVGVAKEGEPLEQEDLVVASRHLNMQIKAYLAYGLQLWKRKTQSITLVAAQSLYTLGPSGDVVIPRPLRILECNRVTTDGISVTMTKLSRNEYENLPNKTQQGVPVNYFYDPTLTRGEFFLWLVPGTQEAADNTVDIVYSAPIEDMTDGLQDFDFPQEWYEAVMLGLAYRLSSVYSLDLQERYLLRKDAKDALDLALSFDVEDTGFYLQPDYTRNTNTWPQS